MKQIRFRIPIYSIALFSFVIFICSCNGSKEDSDRTQTKVNLTRKKSMFVPDRQQNAIMPHLNVWDYPDAQTR